jgi:hypothetical protein
MKNVRSELTRAQCERGIAVLRRVVADERETQSLREAARDEQFRLKRMLEKRKA